MLRKVTLFAVPITALLVACSSSSPNETGQSVGGTYVTNVTLVSNSCGLVTALKRNTTVAHTQGATTLTLTHNNISYSGTLNADATFSTTPKQLGDATTPLTLTITGSFTTTTINATVVVVQGGASPCQYTITWIGPKQGDPNVL